MTDLVFCVVVVCVWDDWLGVLRGGVCVGLLVCWMAWCLVWWRCVCGMTGLVSCVVVVCVWDDWLGLLCGGGVCVG